MIENNDAAYSRLRDASNAFRQLSRGSRWLISISDTALNSPEDLFLQAFDGHDLDEWIGEVRFVKSLYIASGRASWRKTKARPDGIIQLLRRESKTLSAGDRNYKAKRSARVLHLYARLIMRIDPWMHMVKRNGARPYFCTLIAHEASRLRLQFFGCQIMEALGNIYRSKAQNLKMSDLRPGVSGCLGKMKDTAIKTLTGNKDDKKKYYEEILSNSGEWLWKERERYANQLGYALRYAWTSEEFEFCSIVGEVCDKVLNHPSSSPVERIRRAEALDMIGETLIHVSINFFNLKVDLSYIIKFIMKFLANTIV